MTEDTQSVTTSGQQAEDFRWPIEFLAAEHDRQRVLCAALERLAGDVGGAGAAEAARQILDYFETKLGLHYGDEEKGLFPLLRRRAEPDDGIGTILDLLDEEHEADHVLLDRLLGPLRAIAGGGRPTDLIGFAGDARAFSVLQRRHLAWENGTVLALARRRLSADDQRELGRGMAARRGLALP
ncbi:MAG: hemerythrin domain-containing protein [Alphaproteobacteria bacterium]